MPTPPLSRPLGLAWLGLEIDTPLGLRFWDLVARDFIGDGLVVTAHPKNKPDWTILAEANRSGVFVFHGLSVRRGLEAESDRRSSSPAGSLQVSGLVVSVYDEMERYQPFRFSITEPTRGLFDWTIALLSPPDSPITSWLDFPVQSVPLFSSSTRLVPAGMTAVRAHLRPVPSADKKDRKASWAVMDVCYKDKLLCRGMADREGRVAVILPYPPPVISNTGSGVPGDAVPLHRQSWTIEVEVRCQPIEEVSLLDQGMLSRHPERRFPDLTEVLNSSKVTLQDATSSDAPPGTLSLIYGQETIIRTAGQSELYFTNP